MRHISFEHYVQCFEGFSLQDCAVINAHCLSFVLRNLEDTGNHDSLEEQLVRKKIVWMSVTDEEGFQAGGSTIHNSEEIFTTFSLTSRQEMIYANSHGMVWQYTPDGLRQERRIHEVLGRGREECFILTAKTIGNAAYLCGFDGFIACRLGQGAWGNLSLPPEHFPGPPLTLLDMDGFAPDDIYALSWKAGIFHFNGKQWRRVPFPSNITLESLCCGGDGVVYVTGQGGTIFAGRGNVWAMAHEGHLTLPFHDAVWHEDALWCTNDYGVWTLAEGKFGKAPVPDEVYFCSGHLSAREGLLLIGGMNGAALYNGRQWETLYFQPEIMAALLEGEG